MTPVVEIPPGWERVPVGDESRADDLHAIERDGADVLESCGDEKAGLPAEWFRMLLRRKVERDGD